MKSSKTILAAFLVFTSIACFCQGTVQWPAITRQARPWTRWWWEGSAVDKAGLTAAMQQYRQAGLGGLEITPIYGVKGAESKFIDYLTPQWMNMLEFSLQEAKRLNLGIDMATGTGWPFGGPWVSPEDACKDVNVKVYALKGGERLADAITYLQKPLVRTVSEKRSILKHFLIQLQPTKVSRPMLSTRLNSKNNCRLNCSWLIPRTANPLT